MKLVHGLTFDNIRGDIYGGLTAAVVALPLALAFGVASGAGPVAGLYGAIFVGFFAALFGGTPAQISGPTGPMTAIMAGIITQYGNEPAMAFTVVMLAGLFQILFGVLKLGRYISLVPFSGDLRLHERHRPHHHYPATAAADWLRDTRGRHACRLGGAARISPLSEV